MQIGSYNDSSAVKAQYQTSKGLNTRISFHDKYSTNKLGYGNWIVSNYEIPEGMNMGDISITFDGCDFEDGLRFFMNSNTNAPISSFTFKFVNCTYNNQPISKTIAENLNTQFVIPVSWGNHFGHDLNPIIGGHVYYIIETEGNAIKYEIKEDNNYTGEGPKPLIFDQVDPVP